MLFMHARDIFIGQKRQYFFIYGVTVTCNDYNDDKVHALIFIARMMWRSISEITSAWLYNTPSDQTRVLITCTCTS